MTLSTKTLPDLIETYMNGTFEDLPTFAAYLGLHEYDGKIPDLSQAGFEHRLVRLRGQLEDLQALQVQTDAKELVFDQRLLERTIKQEIFDIDQMQAHKLNPMYYAWFVDMSSYIKRDYAPLEQRLEVLLEHLSLVPNILKQAQINLVPNLAKPVLQTAIGMYEGMIAYYNGDITAVFTAHNSPTLSQRFEQIREQATTALAEFVAFLNHHLPDAHMNYAIGTDKYCQMLALGEMVDLPVEEVLAVGRKNLADNFAELKKVCEAYQPGVPVEQIMSEMSKNHPTPETLVSDTVAKLEEVRQFLIDEKIVSVPSEVRCLVQLTPPFLRWAFAFMDAAGPFEKVAKEAYYYLTPVEPEWSDQKKEEWLSKFDYYTLQDVSIHEAYPGHYLHFLHTKLVPSRFRQMVSSYSFIEGWAHYTEQMMLEAGYGAAEPRYKIAQLSEALLRNSRYIVAILMHTQAMTLDEATKFIMDNAYMEETPARSEATRGTFDPGYLNYTLGKLLLLKLRDDYKAEQGANFNLQRFHDQVLAYGAPPVPLLRTILLQNDSGVIL